MTTRRLLLHIGIGKTGSSSIQSAFASAAPKMLEKGVFYPMADRGHAKNWHISGGNGRFLTNGQKIEVPQEAHTIVFSSEAFFGQLMTDANLAKAMKSFCQANAVSHVSYLMFLRDPVEHAESCYQQDIKRRGFVTTPTQAFERYHMPAIALAAIRHIRQSPNSDLTIHNYSSVRDRLFELAAHFIGVPTEILMCKTEKHVNRSLTTDELTLQLELNRLLGRKASRLSDTLCNELPNIKAQRLFPPVEVQSDMLDRLSGTLDELDKYLAVSEQLKRAIRPPEDPQRGLNDDQLKIIARVMSDYAQLDLEKIKR